MVIEKKDRREKDLWEINPIKAMMEEAKKEGSNPHEINQIFIHKLLNNNHEIIERMKECLMKLKTILSCYQV